jgi:hypothetical protein
VVRVTAGHAGKRRYQVAMPVVMRFARGGHRHKAFFKVKMGPFLFFPMSSFHHTASPHRTVLPPPHELDRCHAIVNVRAHPRAPPSRRSWWRIPNHRGMAVTLRRWDMLGWNRERERLVGEETRSGGGGVVVHGGGHVMRVTVLNVGG